MKYLQTGNVQWYAVGLFVGVIAMAVVFIESSERKRGGDMTWENSAITITTLLPIVGALVIAADAAGQGSRHPRPRHRVHGQRRSCSPSAIAIGFDYGTDGLQYVLDVNWISAIGVRFHVGIDGISLPAVRADLPALVPLRDLQLALRARPGPHQGVPRR